MNNGTKKHSNIGPRASDILLNKKLQLILLTSLLSESFGSPLNEIRTFSHISFLHKFYSQYKNAR